MKVNRNKINLVTILIVGIGIQVYYKTKFLLMGQLEISELWHWITLVELAFGFLLSGLVVVGHDFVVSILRERIQWTSQVKRLLIQVGITSLYAVLASYLFTIFFWEFILQIPMTAEYIFDFVIVALFIPLIVNGITESLYYYGAWEAESFKKEQLEKENIKARYEILKNQISPHFLFNCFNTLAVLIEEGKKAASDFLKQLSKVYRFVLETKESEIIKLKEELDVFNSYAQLLRIRFGESFVLNNSIESKEKDYYIAPLTMQILLENALKHNYSSINKPLRIDVEVANEHLIFTNNLDVDSSQLSLGMGLQNIESRYKYLTGKEILVKQSNDRFSVKIPLILVDDI